MQDFLFYLKLGWDHIISSDALDHQLFVLVLAAVYAYRDWKKILLLVSAFTVGHSVTLALSVLDVIRIPANWVEFLIPLTIFLTALDNLLLKNKENRLMKINYYLALCFGLIHGMGFANTARMMMAQEQDIVLPLLGFNTGLEAGQILVISLILISEFLLHKFFRISKMYWMLMVSLLTLIISGVMCITRFPLI